MKKERQQDQKFDPNSSDYKNKQSALSAEINKGTKVTIDRSIFSKTAEEKILLKQIKQDYKDKLKTQQ